jgi:hypothetical protein
LVRCFGGLKFEITAIYSKFSVLESELDADVLYNSNV